MILECKYLTFIVEQITPMAYFGNIAILTNIFRASRATVLIRSLGIFHSISHDMKGRVRNIFDSSNLPLGQKALFAYLRHLDHVYILRASDNLYNDSALIVVRLSR